MKITLERSKGLNLRVSEAWLRQLIANLPLALSELKVSLPEGKVYIYLVGRSRFQRIRERYIGEALDSDVVSLRYDSPLGRSLLIGEIYVNVPRVIDNARKFNRSLKEELTFVLLHGFLHLAGYDDSTEEERKNMFRLQERGLDLLKRLIPKLFIIAILLLSVLAVSLSAPLVEKSSYEVIQTSVAAGKVNSAELLSLKAVVSSLRSEKRGENLSLHFDKGTLISYTRVNGVSMGERRLEPSPARVKLKLRPGPLRLLYFPLYFSGEYSELLALYPQFTPLSHWRLVFPYLSTTDLNGSRIYLKGEFVSDISTIPFASLLPGKIFLLRTRGSSEGKAITGFGVLQALFLGRICVNFSLIRQSSSQGEKIEIKEIITWISRG